MAKKTNFKTLGDAELTKLVGDARKELREHRFAAAGSRPKDTNSLRKSRVTVARALTELTLRAKK